MHEKYKSLAKDFTELWEVLCSDEMEDVMISAFGDHARITITKDSIDVEEYDHD